jgi:signal transduction histidine kinase
MELVTDLRLEPDEGAPETARRSLEPLRGSFTDPLVDEAMLLLSEVVTNSVRHADLGPSDRIDVRVRGGASGLHVDVIDAGPGFDPDRVRARAAGGFGLRLVDRLAARWGVARDDVTRVWFELDPSVPR